MLYPQTQVAQRRRKITKMVVRGMTPSEISDALDTPRDTVYNDIRHIRSGRNEDLAEYGRKQMLAQVMINARERVRQLWRVVETSESPYVQLLALRELRIHDQQVLSHIFLFTQVGNDEEEQIEQNIEAILDSEAVILNRLEGAEDPSKSVKKRHKSLSGKGKQLQVNSGGGCTLKDNVVMEEDENGERKGINSGEILKRARHDSRIVVRCSEK